MPNDDYDSPEMDVDDFDDGEDEFSDGSDYEEQIRKAEDAAREEGRKQAQEEYNKKLQQEIDKAVQKEREKAAKEVSKDTGSEVKGFSGEGFRKAGEEDRLGRRNVARLQGNLEQAERVSERILEASEQLRMITESSFSVIAKMENARMEMRKTTESAIQANESMEALVNTIKDFFVKDYQGMLNDSNRRLMSSFITQSRDGYLQLFHMAVKNFKQFTESAIKWQQKLESESGKELKTVAATAEKMPRYIYIILGIQVVQLVLILFFVVFR